MTFDSSALALDDSRSWPETWEEIVPLPSAPPSNSTSTRTYNRVLLRAALEESLRRLFDERVAIWLDETKWQSSMSSITSHRMFSELKDMKEDALKFTLQRMRSGEVHLHWFPLLLDLAGHDPVPRSSRGFVPEMTAAWLEWGADAGKI